MLQLCESAAGGSRERLLVRHDPNVHLDRLPKLKFIPFNKRVQAWKTKRRSREAACCKPIELQRYKAAPRRFRLALTCAPARPRMENYRFAVSSRLALSHF
jgi:hypothetical protein